MMKTSQATLMFINSIYETLAITTKVNVFVRIQFAILKVSLLTMVSPEIITNMSERVSGNGDFPNMGARFSDTGGKTIHP